MNSLIRFTNNLTGTLAIARQSCIIKVHEKSSYIVKSKTKVLLNKNVVKMHNY